MQSSAQDRKALILDPRQTVVLGAASPVSPGAEGADGSRLGLLLQPRGDNRVMVRPCGDLAGVAKPDLNVVDGQASATKGFPDARLSALDALSNVGMGTEHGVVPLGFERRAHHFLDRSPRAQYLLACLHRRDLPGF